MPRKPWVPLEHERELFHEIYIDETSWTDHHYMVIGGVVVPLAFSAQLEAEIEKAKPSRLKGLNSKGKLREASWTDISKNDYHDYKSIVDALFAFNSRIPGSLKDFRIYASIIDLSVRGRNYSGGERGRVGFERELYYHCLSIARRNKRTHLFHVYPDERSTKTPERTLQGIMCRGLAKEPDDKRSWAYRRLNFRKSNEVAAIQASDIVIGAIAYYINGSFHKPEAGKDKKLLCEYILKKYKIWDHLENGKMEKAYGPLFLWFREHLS